MSEMTLLVKILMNMSPAEIAEFVETHPYYAVKIKTALKKLKATVLEHKKVEERINKCIDRRLERIIIPDGS